MCSKLSIFFSKSVRKFLCSMTRVLLVLFVYILSVEAFVFLTTKSCKDENASNCDVYYVVLDPCLRAPSYCLLKSNKYYILTVDMRPQFPLSKLQLAMYGDVNNTGSFDKELKPRYPNACQVLLCPAKAATRQIFDFDFTVGTGFPRNKFPVKVKLWDEDDASKMCCFTFTAQVK